MNAKQLAYFPAEMTFSARAAGIPWAAPVHHLCFWVLSGRHVVLPSGLRNVPPAERTRCSLRRPPGCRLPVSCPVPPGAPPPCAAWGL